MTILKSEVRGARYILQINEFKGKVGDNKLQLIVADVEIEELLDILSNGRKETIIAYLREHDANNKSGLILITQINPLFV